MSDQALVVRLRDALFEYGRHLNRCASQKRPGEPGPLNCDCGFGESLLDGMAGSFTELAAKQAEDEARTEKLRQAWMKEHDRLAAENAELREQLAKAVEMLRMADYEGDDDYESLRAALAPAPDAPRFIPWNSEEGMEILKDVKSGKITWAETEQWGDAIELRATPTPKKK